MKQTAIPPEQRASMQAAREARKGERADYLKVRAGNANFETPVRDHLARLKGRSTSHVADDRTRGARSPLEERRKQR